ncbi:MAG: hypothetical protein JWM11_3283 [Planctomycetaceae bacterium]|nr:hypothetical protein [Planctomycetaceae bacterium]
MSSLSFEPLISPAAWIALAAASALLLGWYARSRPLVITRQRWVLALALTALGTSAVLVILLNPTWLEVIPLPAGKPVLTILVDQSASMRVADSDAGQSRYQSATQAAVNLSQRSSEMFAVELRSFGDSTAVVSPDELSSQKPERQATDLAAAVAATLGTDHPQGHAVVLLSDGIHNGASGVTGLREILRSAKAMNVPIYTSTFGGDTVLKDLEVAVARPQDLAFIGQKVPFSVVVRQRGRLTDSAEVLLLQDGKEIDRQRAVLSASGTATVRFEVSREQSGLYHYEVKIDPLPGEATAANNTASMMLRIVDEPVRVLLLEGKPYWDGKFLVRTLSADPSLELDALVRVSESRILKRSLRLRRASTTTPSGGGAETPAANRVDTSEILAEPISFLDGPDGLSACQVVVLGRDAEAFLNDRILERLRHWISHDGGSLVCYRGSPVARANQELARLLPVRWTPARESRFRLRLTERGQETDWLTSARVGDDGAFEKLPALSTMSSPENPKPLAVVLATSERESGPALVTYQPYGTGRVVAIEGAGMWRWAFLAPQFQQHDQVYSALWQSLLRWLISSVGLIPGQDLALRTDQVTYTTGEAVSALLLMRNEASGGKIPVVELQREGESEESQFTPVPLGDEPGVYRMAFGALPTGRYRAKVVTGDKKQEQQGSAALSTTAFEVRPYFGEELDVQARPDLMKFISEETGGEVLTTESSTGLTEAFEKHLARSRTERIRRLTAWDRWWVYVFVLSAWGSAWGLRRSAGLI